MQRNLLLLLLFPLFSFCYQSYVTVAQDDKVSIEFPDLPQETAGSKGKIWTADVKGAARCMATIVDLSSGGLTAAEVNKMLESPRSFQNFREGMMVEMPGSSVVSEGRSKIAGYPAFEFNIDMGDEHESGFKMLYNRNIFIGTKIYTVNVYEVAGPPQPAMRDRFFHSIKVL